MVSLHKSTRGSKKREINRSYEGEFQRSSKKRKQEDVGQVEDQSSLLNKPKKSEKARSITFDFELHLCTPLPLDWQDTKSQSRISEEHRTHLEEPARYGSHKMSLDLELNLSPSDSPTQNNTKIVQSSSYDDSRSLKGHNFTTSNKNTNTIGLSPCPSWLAFDGDDDDDGQKKKKEMVAAVCMKCHMLVMLCKSTPVCPNCKFMHPHDHSSANLFKPSRLLSLLC